MLPVRHDTAQTIYAELMARSEGTDPRMVLTFPVELPGRLIELYTYVGDLVLDPFCGSGQTLPPPMFVVCSTETTRERGE